MVVASTLLGFAHAFLWVRVALFVHPADPKASITSLDTSNSVSVAISWTSQAVIPLVSAKAMMETHPKTQSNEST